MPMVISKHLILCYPQVGVVGRTGAGKHSMVAAILRLFEPNGVIRIDGVDTATLSLKVGNIAKVMKI